MGPVILPLLAFSFLQASANPASIDAPQCPSAMVALKQVKPEYPRSALESGAEGAIDLKALVGTNGEIKDVVVVSGDSAWANAAVKALKKWKYPPCVIDGKPEEVSVLVRFRFSFKKQEQYATTCEPSEPAPPMKPLERDQSGRVKVGSGVTAGRLVYGPKPEYPAVARAQRLQGAVVMCAVIGKDGSIKSLGVLKGHPVLADAAVAAVKQWRYKPYLLDGKPVEIDTHITVNFQL